VFRAVVPVVLCRISTRTLMQEGHRYYLEWIVNIWMFVTLRTICPKIHL
jgi:hypothetical protein